LVLAHRNGNCGRSSDFTHAFDAFVNTMSGVGIASLRNGIQSIGVKDNEVLSPS
jgi:hypothetical protein